MIYKVFYPSDSIKDFIKYYWYMEDHVGNPKEKDLLIPDLSSELIFNFDTLYHRFSLRQDVKENITKSCLIGQRSISIIANRPSKVRLFGIKFKPGALFSFFGIPEKELKNSSISLSDLNSNSLIELEDKILNQKKIKLLPAQLDQYFIQKLKSFELVDLNIFNSYLKKIARLKDASELESFRAENQIHYKKLERLFARYAGISARSFIKINRFKNFYKAFNKGQHNFYNSSIYEFGYYDQNHFIKDFTFFTNQNPSQYYKIETQLTDSILIQTLDFLKKAR